jgi:hypothetical protein
VTDDDLHRRDALRRLRAPRPIKDERPTLEPSYILGEEIYIPPTWHCEDCDTRRPVPEQLAVRGSSVATARRIVAMYKAWGDMREVLRRGLLPDFIGTWPNLCVWCLERDALTHEYLTLKLNEVRKQAAMQRLQETT